jgi:hypothetical protein
LGSRRRGSWLEQLRLLIEKEVRLPSGRRADAVNFEQKHVKELKPDNPRAIGRGEKQVEGYRGELQEEFGGDWTSSIETYKR